MPRDGGSEMTSTASMFFSGTLILTLASRTCRPKASGVLSATILNPARLRWCHLRSRWGAYQGQRMSQRMKFKSQRQGLRIHSISNRPVRRLMYWNGMFLYTFVHFKYLLLIDFKFRWWKQANEMCICRASRSQSNNSMIICWHHARNLITVW